MASGTADLQRDLGGAIMQSIFGALLTAGYAAAIAADRWPRRTARDHRQRPGAADEVLRQREAVAAAVPRVREGDHAAAKASFLAGTLGVHRRIIAVLIGAAIVFRLFPGKADEERLLAEYHAEDAGRAQKSGPCADQPISPTDLRVLTEGPGGPTWILSSSSDLELTDELTNIDLIAGSTNAPSRARSWRLGHHKEQARDA